MTKEYASNQPVEPTADVSINNEAMNEAVNAAIGVYIAALAPLDVVDRVVLAESKDGELYVWNILTGEWTKEFIDNPALDDVSDAASDLVDTVKPYTDTFIFGVTPSHFPQLMSDCESKGMTPVVVPVKE